MVLPIVEQHASHTPESKLRAGSREFLPAVTIAVAKRKVTNAVTVAENVLQRVEPLKGNVIPADVQVDLTAAQLFDLSLLDEVYKEHPELIG